MFRGCCLLVLRKLGFQGSRWHWPRAPRAQRQSWYWSNPPVLKGSRMALSLRPADPQTGIAVKERRQIAGFSRSWR